MKKKLLTTILILLILVAYINCGCIEEEKPKKTYEVPIFSPNQTEFTDEEIRAAVYSSYKYPKGFYQEEFNGTSFYYVNTISTDLSEDKWIELSTDDVNQALEWFKLHKINKTVKINDIQETEKYFNIHGLRIHKSSYINRSNYDGLSKNYEDFGTFNQRPITINNVKELIEYLWFIKNYLLSSLVVLSSFSQDLNDTILHTIFEAKIIIREGNADDEIHLEELKYLVNKTTGNIVFEKIEIKKIQGEFN